MKRVLLLLLLLSPFISKFSYSQATTVTFTAVKSGNWNDPTVWSISGTTTHTYPSSNGSSDTSTYHDAVIIGVDGSSNPYTVTMTSSTLAYYLYLEGGAINYAGYNLTLYQSGSSTSGSTPLSVVSSTNTGSFTGSGSIILTGHNYIKIYAGSGLTVQNLNYNPTGTFSGWNNLCALNSGNLIITGTLTLNNTFCLGTKELSLYNSITNANNLSGASVLTGNGTSNSSGTSVSAAGNLCFKSSSVTFPANLLSTSSVLTALTIDVGSGNTYTLPGNLTMASGKLTITSGTFSTGSSTFSAGLTGSTIAPNATLSVPASSSAIFGGASPLTIQSDATGTGSIAAVGGSITGISNVTVNRYVGSAGTWRMIGFPLTSSTSISASALATLYGSSYNAYTYNEASDDQTNYGNSGTANAGWTLFTGSATTTANNGILIIGGTPSSTISATGALNTGTQSIPLSKSKNGWNLIANPFPSAINWTTIAANNSSLVNNAIYRYDPSNTAYATYVNGSSTGNQSNVIENGAGFFVQAIAAGNLSIAESDKTTSAPLASLMGMGPQQGRVTTDGASAPAVATPADASIIKLSLAKQGDQYADEVVLRWGVDPATDAFDGKYDAYDMGRAAGPDLSVIGNDATVYSIFHGSELKTSSVENRTVQLGIKNITEGTYQLGIQLLSPVANGNKAYLYDSYTNTATLIDGNTNTYSFITTADPKSQSSTRFSVVMNYKEAVNTINTNLPVMLLNNPTTNSVFTLYSKNNYNQLQWQVVDGSGRALQIGAFNSVQKGSTYQINAGTIANGNYFIKLTGDGNALPVLKAIKN